MTILRFLPSMTLQAAARIAGEHGLELRVQWDGKQPKVTAVTPIDKMDIPAFLKKQAG